MPILNTEGPLPWAQAAIAPLAAKPIISSSSTPEAPNWSRQHEIRSHHISSNNDVNALRPTTPPPGAEPDLGDGDYIDPEERTASGRANCPSHRLKHIYRVRENAWALLRRSKRGHALFITLTLADEGDGHPDSLEAQSRLEGARPVLDGLFPEWFLVMEFNPESGLPHFHGIAIADANVSRGWHHQPYEEIGKLNRRAHRERRKLTEAELVQRRAWSRHLTPNKDLRLIQDVLGEVLPDFGFGRSQPSHATPLQSWKKTHLSSPEVRGRVVDAATKKPISGAVVQILDRPYTKVQSDPAGRFRMQPHFNLHLACIPGPCSYLYIPEGRPYSDDMIVTHPRYTSCQFPAHRLSATHITSVEPERVTTSDIRLELKAR